MSTESNSKAGSPVEKRLKIVAFTLLLSEFVRSLGYNLYTISLPIIAQQMAQSAILTGIAVSIFGFVQSIAQIPFGRLSDKHGRRGILLFSAFVYALGALMVGFAQDILQFILFRAIQAFGAVMSVLQACLSDIFPPERRGTAMAWFSIVYAVGTIVGLPLGGLIAGGFGLRMPFYLCAILSFVSAGILVLFLRETLPGKIKQQIKPAQVVDDLHIKITYSGVEREEVTEVPAPAFHYYRVKGFFQTCIIGLTVSFTMGSFFAFAPIFLESLGYTVLDMGLIFIPGILVFFCGSIFSGMLSDRVGRKMLFLLELYIAAPFSFLVLVGPSSVVDLVGIVTFLGNARCQL